MMARIAARQIVINLWVIVSYRSPKGAVFPDSSLKLN
jgi:hypothetical protein